jgi:hypothetical protein
MLNLKDFLYNFFFILVDLYKVNFGYLYNLNLYDKKNKEYMDFSFFLEIQIFLFKFFNLFKKNYLNNFFLKFFKRKKDISYNKFLKKIIKYKICTKLLKKNKIYLNRL